MLNTLEKHLKAQIIKYAVQKTIFCPYTEAILDYRTAIMFELYMGDKLIETRVSAPKMKQDIPIIKEQINLTHPELIVKIYDLKNEY